MIRKYIVITKMFFEKNKDKIIIGSLGSIFGGGGWYITNLGKQLELQRQQLEHMEEKYDIQMKNMKEEHNIQMKNIEENHKESMREIKNNMREIRQYIIQNKNH